MSAKTTAAPVVSRDAVAAEIAAEIMSSLTKPSVEKTLGVSINEFVANRIADSGDGIAELSAGFSAAGRNFKVARKAALVRQEQRTAGKVAALVEHELRARGL